MNQTVTNIFFSPSGTTSTSANLIATNISNNIQNINLLKNKITEEQQFTSNDIVIVSMPVFAGRIPAICADMLKNLKGNNTPAIAVVVYGNRAYEDALLELTNILTENGFIIAGAAALVAQHSIFTKVAHGRPDASDIEKIKNFATQCAAAIKTKTFPALSVPGNSPYRAPSSIPLSISVGSNCNECGACVRICPVGAIPAENPQSTDSDKCINCTACISACPKHVRKYGGIKYFLGSKAFSKKCAARCEPEFFIG